MTPLARRLTALYLALLLLLAALGAYGQQRFLHQATLLERKDAAVIELAVARSAAAGIQGPLAVTHWARERGMVPAPDALDVIPVAPSPLPPPSRTLATPTLEVRTVWR
jgi:hypothetical protein